MGTIIDSRLDKSKTIADKALHPKIVWLLTGLQIILAIGALFGGGAFILAPDGHLLHMPFGHLQNSPFPNFLVPGILLFVCVGIFPLMVGYSLWNQPDWHWPNFINPFKQLHWSWAGSLAAGTAVFIWIIVQVLWVPFGFVHAFYLVYGIVLITLTLRPDIRHFYALKE